MYTVRNSGGGLLRPKVRDQIGAPFGRGLWERAMPVVTITGRVGSPARALGLEVAQRLGADYVDNRILAEASHRSGASLETVAQKDERALRGRERLARFFQNFLEKSAAAGSAGDPFLGPTGVEVLLSRSMAEAARPSETQAQELDDKRYLDLISGVVQDLASSGNVVLIGRGSHVVLKDLPNALHLFVVSSEASRVAYLRKREGMSEEQALKHIRDTDPQRVAYYKKVFGVQSEDPTLYHLFLNVDRLGVEHAGRIAADAALTQAGQLAAA